MLQNFIWWYSISCLSLCLDQLNYIVIDDRDALSSGFYITYILISTLLANEKGDYLPFVRGVVVLCYQYHKQGATTLHDKNSSPWTTTLCMSCIYKSVYY